VKFTVAFPPECASFPLPALQQLLSANNSESTLLRITSHAPFFTFAVGSWDNKECSQYKKHNQ
jgi:hypothetical protein